MPLHFGKVARQGLGDVSVAPAGGTPKTAIRPSHRDRSASEQRSKCVPNQDFRHDSPA